MTIELIKMDGRHSGNHYFTHYANFIRYTARRKGPRITGFSRLTTGGVGPLRSMDRLEDIVKEFVQCRNWCWEQFGPSCEVTLYDQAVHAFAFGPEKPDPDWAWAEKEYGRRIYFKDETVAGMFSLMWCK